MKNKRFLAFLLVISFFIQLCPIEIAAEGSKNMVESGMGDRPYIEWFNNRTAGLLRMQKVYVYAKAGETIFFGSSTAQNLSRSSVISSLNNSFGKDLGNSSRARAAKFAVTLPYSQDEGENEEVTYRFHRGTNDIDGIQDSNYGNSDIFLFTYSITTGMIRNVTQESNGPNITGISLASMALAENVQTAENSIGQADSNEIAGETVIESTTAADSTQSGNGGGGGSKDNTTSSSAIDVPESVNPSYGDETDVVEDKTEITTAEDNSQENTPVQGETADSSISGAAIYTDSSINNFADYNAFMEDNCDENTEILQPDVDAAPVSDEVASASAAVYAMSDGYTPYYFKAPLTGVYTFRFFGGDYTSGDNPPPVSVNSNWSGTDSNRNNYIAAWDITVYKNTGVKASGRVFVDRLFLNMGNNSRSLYAKNYVLTDDGFEYMIDFNGIDPWGFLFYANNRGMLLKTALCQELG